MTINQIKSNRVRLIISGSSTPALDLIDEIGARRLTQEETNEAIEYFFSLGGLRAVATAEQNFCIDNDI
jgi:hypothetical protein